MIVRSKDRHVSVPASLLLDDRLSFEARGVVAWIMAHEGEDVDGYDVPIGAEIELEDCGYVVRDGDILRLKA